MRRRLGIAAAALVTVMGLAGFTLAQTGMPNPEEMNGNIMSMRMMMHMMAGQPLSAAQLAQFAGAHGITVDAARRMIDSCLEVMKQAAPVQPETL